MSLALDREQILLKEYEICHDDSNALASRFWSFANIFIPTNLALLALLITALLKKEVHVGILETLIVGVIGICAIITLVSVLLWLKRTNSIQQSNYERAREIECTLGMWKNWRLHALDRYDVRQKNFVDSDPEIDSYMSTKLFDYRPPDWWQRTKEKNSFFSRAIGSRVVCTILITIMVLWFLLITYSFLLTFFNICCSVFPFINKILPLFH